MWILYDSLRIALWNGRLERRVRGNNEQSRYLNEHLFVILFPMPAADFGQGALPRLLFESSQAAFFQQAQSLQYYSSNSHNTLVQFKTISYDVLAKAFRRSHMYFVPLGCRLCAINPRRSGRTTARQLSTSESPANDLQMITKLTPRALAASSLVVGRG